MGDNLTNQESRVKIVIFAFAASIAMEVSIRHRPRKRAFQRVSDGMRVKLRVNKLLVFFYRIEERTFLLL